VTVIAHLSDPHLDTSSARLGRLTRVLDEVGALSAVDVLLVTGDLADHGAAQEYEEFFAALPEDLATIVVPGNHDRRAVMREFLPSMPAQGPLNSAVAVGDLTVLGLDSLIEDSDAGALDAETLAFAERHIDNAAGPVVLALHHPPVAVGHAIMDQYALANTNDLATLVSRSESVIACFTGHVHTALATTFAGRPLIGAPGIVSTMRLGSKTDPIADPDASPGFALHTLSPRGHLSTIFHYLTPA
jgi:3',5'-cyclic-AMP phosphodiesterase